MASSAPLLAAAMLTACVLVADAAAPAARTHTITIAQMRFQPATLTVREGDIVEWVNDDLVPHTATSGTGQFDSGPLVVGQRWRWTMRERGQFDYVCRLHPNMSARVDVLGR